ncbi:MAG: hypothetical protein R3B09_12905 [Nannocystaceae bacterium]
MPADGSDGADSRPEPEVEVSVDEPATRARGAATKAVVVDPRARRRRRRPRIHEISYDESERRARRIVARIRGRFVGAPVEVQERVGQMMGLLDDLRIPHDRGLLLTQAELAVLHLDHPKPSLVIFDRTFEHLRSRVSGRGLRFARIFVSASPHIIVAGGVALSMVICMVLLVWGLTILQRPDLEALRRVTEAGFAGALTSVMLRFNRWRGHRHFTSRDAFFEGLFRPFIGVFFAWMCYYFLEAGFLPFQPEPGVEKINLFSAVAFAAGFSERLAVTFVEGLEGRKSG